MKETLSMKEKLQRELRRRRRWTPGYELMLTQTRDGWIGKSADRRLRELASEGTIENNLNEEGYAIYRAGR